MATSYTVRKSIGAWSVHGQGHLVLVAAPTQQMAFTFARKLAEIHEQPCEVLVYDEDGHLRVRWRYPEGTTGEPGAPDPLAAGAQEPLREAAG
jgi:hypothetical protein